MSELEASPLRIAIVGPCASGKTTLAHVLREAGYVVRQPAQEHSYVQTMWQRLVQPDVLIYLDVDYEAICRRRPKMGGGPERLHEQHERLAHARAHCDLYLDTSSLTPDEVRDYVVDRLVQS